MTPDRAGQAITPQRDMFATLTGGAAELPGMSEEDERYFRDIYDHLIRISDLIDTYRDVREGGLGGRVRCPAWAHPFGWTAGTCL